MTRFSQPLVRTGHPASSVRLRAVGAAVGCGSGASQSVDLRVVLHRQPRPSGHHSHQGREGRGEERSGEDERRGRERGREALTHACARVGRHCGH